MAAEKQHNPRNEVFILMAIEKAFVILSILCIDNYLTEMMVLFIPQIKKLNFVMVKHFKYLTILQTKFSES